MFYSPITMTEFKRNRNPGVYNEMNRTGGYRLGSPIAERDEMDTFGPIASAVELQQR